MYKIMSNFLVPNEEIANLIAKPTKYMTDSVVFLRIEIPEITYYKSEPFLIVCRIYYNMNEKKRCVQVMYDFKTLETGTRSTFVFEYDHESVQNMLVQIMEAAAEDWSSLNKDNFWLNMKKTREKDYYTAVLQGFLQVVEQLKSGEIHS